MDGFFFFYFKMITIILASPLSRRDQTLQFMNYLTIKFLRIWNKFVDFEIFL